MATQDQTSPLTTTLSLYIHLLGPLRLTWGTEALSLPHLTTACSLLAYLALHHNRALPRDLLAGTFWPDRPDGEARKALSDALWRIRQRLGPAENRLVVERDTVALKLQTTDQLDVATFAAHLRR